MKIIKKLISTTLLIAALSTTMVVTAMAGAWNQDAFGDWYETAGEWKKDGNKTWYAYEDGTFPASTWQWISNEKGNSKCYYFDENGYILKNASLPDGSQVNSEGEWKVGNKVRSSTMQKREGGAFIHFGFYAEDDADIASYGYTNEGISNIIIDTLNHTRQENAQKYGTTFINYGQDSITHRFKGIPLQARYVYDKRIDNGMGKMNYTPFSVELEPGSMGIFLSGLDNKSTIEECVNILQSRGFSVTYQERSRVDMQCGDYLYSIYRDDAFGLHAIITTKQRAAEGLWN